MVILPYGTMTAVGSMTVISVITNDCYPSAGGFKKKKKKKEAVNILCLAVCVKALAIA